MNAPSARLPDAVPVAEYVRGSLVPLSRLTHDWELHSAVPLTPAEERTMVREPAQAVPASIAQRLGALRVLLVPYVECLESGDIVCFAKPAGDTHTSVWIEAPERTSLVLSCRQLDAHDTGFEFLASVAELLRPRLSSDELERFSRLLEEELRQGVTGEIDEEAISAKKPLLSERSRRRGHRETFQDYCAVSFVSTLAEYVHGMWHDVQIRTGPEHLPLPALRRRMTLLAEMFPPNPDYRVFDEALDKPIED